MDEERKARIIQKAVDQHRVIYPCGQNKDLRDCFTIQGDKILFWFNTEDQTTRIISEGILEKI